MDRRAQTNERHPARYPEEAALLPRRLAPTSPTYPPPGHAGPSRQSFDPRDGSEFGWNARPGRPLDPTVPSDAWLTDGRGVPRPPQDDLARIRSIGEVPIAASPYGGGPAYGTPTSIMPAPTPLPHSRRTSAEEWQRHEDPHMIPRKASLPSAMPPSIHPSIAALGHEPGHHRDMAPLIPAMTPRQSALPPSISDPDPPRARVACAFCRVRKLRCDGATPCRHCERRNMECVYAANKSKAKSTARAPSSQTKSHQDESSTDYGRQQQEVNSKPLNGNDQERGTKRTKSPNSIDEADLPTYDIKRAKMSMQPQRLVSGSDPEGNKDASSPTTRPRTAEGRALT